MIVEADDGADGAGLVRILKTVVSIFPSAWAVLSDVDLVGPARVSLVTSGRDVRVLPVRRLLELLQQAEQVVWATIFLCSTREASEQITGAEDYAPALRKATALIRVVDAGWFYVYGPADDGYQLRDGLPGEYREGFAEDLDFPE